MESGNLTLNRRFIKGVPGLPQCPDYANHPNLVTSFCLNAKMITALCEDSNNPQNLEQFNTPCPNKTICMNFKTAPDPSIAPEYEVFAMCVDEGSVKSFNNNRKDGFFCKTYKVDSVTNGKATISVDIYDANSKLVKVRSISIDTGSQHGSMQDTNNYTSIINCKNGQKIKTC
ncbi:hypothetical protein Glove_444g5 [Diversispora epigaea]|uniref:Uncharacterized protein n=1 Tax=Diversispora epigaea TaxID=1348612 RepID=A0A397GYS0_9GLOM|nr:hypothetical protein Glove_444g5 [Diversispora epigaea]